MRIVFNAAARHVVRGAQPKVPVRTGRLAGSIRPASTQRTGRVAYGRPGSVPYAGWIEFGGTRGRPYEQRGRYLFPAAEEERRAVFNSLVRELDRLIQRAGLG